MEPVVVIVAGEIVEFVHDCNALCGDGVTRMMRERHMRVPDAHRWTVTGPADASTVSPSLQCLACGLHGHWKEGRWTG